MYGGFELKFVIHTQFDVGQVSIRARVATIVPAYPDR